MRFLVSFCICLTMASSDFASADIDRPDRLQQFLDFARNLDQGHDYSKLDSEITQDLIDWTIAKLLSTPVGGYVGKTLLADCDPKSVHLHLGATLNNPYSLDPDFCHSQIEAHPFVAPDPGRNLTETASPLGRRVYEIILFSPEQQALPPFDSWTDLESKATTIFIDSSLPANKVLSHLARTIAHETAIYLDAKANITRDRLSFFSSQSWLKISQTNTNQGNPGTTESDFLTASQNPIVQYITSYIRAFRLEKAWVSELDIAIFEDELLKPYSDAGSLPFFKACDSRCLLQYFGSVPESSMPNVISLMTASFYGRKKTSQLISRGIQTEREKLAYEVLRRRYRRVFPKLTLRQILGQEKTPILTDGELKWKDELQESFRSFLVEDDIRSLLTFSVEENEETLEALEWLTKPALSNQGIAWTYGARPRIVSSQEGQVGSQSVSSQGLGFPDFDLIKSPTLEEATVESTRSIELESPDGN